MPLIELPVREFNLILDEALLLVEASVEDALEANN